MHEPRILFEDNHLIVAEKPRGVLSQSDGSRTADMLTVLKSYIKTKYDKPGNVYLGLVHRLDRAVGGVMVFARTSKAASRISAQIRERRFGKVYLAVVEGIFSESSGTLDDYVVKDRSENIVRIASATEMTTVATAATVATANNAATAATMDTAATSLKRTEGMPKRALLDYRVLESNSRENLSLIKVILRTGRSHQIRVQFAAVGHPIAGDAKYGSGGVIHTALWAYSITFLHPVGGEPLEVKCAPPSESPWDRFDIGKLISEYGL